MFNFKQGVSTIQFYEDPSQLLAHLYRTRYFQPQAQAPNSSVSIFM